MTHKELNAAFYYADGRWEYGSRLVGGRAAEAALDRIKSGVELLKQAVLEAEQISAEQAHEYLEIVLACHGTETRR